MTKRILLVKFPDDATDIIKSRIKDLGKEIGIEILSDTAEHQREAALRLDDVAYDLVIVDVDLARDGDSIVQKGEHLGLSLLQQVKSQKKMLPMVLLGGEYEEEVDRQLVPYSDVRYTNQVSDNWDDWLSDVCKQLLLAELPAIKDKHLDVDIILSADNTYSYKMKLIGSPTPEIEGTLDLDEKELTRLRRESTDAGDSKHWDEYLRDIGERLFKQIFEDNFYFSKTFYEYRGELSNKNDVTIRFVVKRRLHPIALEAIKESGENNNYWMLKGPIYRRVREYTDRYALFQDKETREGPINVIIIQADIESTLKIPKLGIELKHLKNVEKEVKELCEHLDALKREKQHNIGEVKVVNARGEHESFKAAVRSALTSGKWHIVHYAGHSYFDDDTNIGRMFFPGGSVANLNEISATAEEFANWLSSSDTRFVYLSSCHSSEEDFVFELANKQVPAVVGFRWDLADRLADEYTKNFYEHLFEKKSLEYAFLEARKAMHEQDRAEPIWASPILVIQTKKE